MTEELAHQEIQTEKSNDLPSEEQKNSTAPNVYSRYEKITEILSAIMLGIVAVATAWSGYQSARWGGLQSSLYGQASARRIESTRASTMAGQLTQIDIAIFMNWVDAVANENTDLQNFYQNRFRPEFLSAFDAWIATDPINNPDAPKSPFSMAEYQLEEENLAFQLEKEAEQLFEEGQEANEISDKYVLTTVLLASVLFFIALAERFEWPPVQTTILIFAFIMLVIGLSNLVNYPIE
jgi:hypothetical protein